MHRGYSSDPGVVLVGRWLDLVDLAVPANALQMWREKESLDEKMTHLASDVSPPSLHQLLGWNFSDQPHRPDRLAPGCAVHHL